MPNLVIKLSMQDLERLLCDKDGGCKLEISNAIVQEFSRKYLKALAQAYADENISVLAREAMKDVFVSRNYGRDVALAESAKEAVKRQVAVAISEIVDEELERRSGGINDCVADVCQQKLDYLLDKLVNERIRAAVSSIQDAAWKAYSSLRVTEPPHD